MTVPDGNMLSSFKPVCVLEASLSTVSKCVTTPSVEGQDGVLYHVARFKSAYNLLFK